MYDNVTIGELKALREAANDKNLNMDKLRKLAKEYEKKYEYDWITLRNLMTFCKFNRLPGDK